MASLEHIMAAWVVCGLLSWVSMSLVKSHFDYKKVFAYIIIGPLGLIEITCR